MINILFAASEAVPFIKTGGLADVAGSLPAHFNRKEWDVRVMLPLYACMDQEHRKELTFVRHFYMNLGWRKQYAGIYEAKHRGITYYLIDNEFYFGGDKPYNLIHEDIEKFSFFSKAVLESIPYLDWKPDLIHCHDWQTGLIPVYLHSLYKNDPAYSRIKTVYTIHNLKFQGRWTLKGLKDSTGLPASLFTPEYLEFYGEGNCLKGGIVFTDCVTTVSPSYAREITTPEGGEGLDGLLKSKGDRLKGILNGIDQTEFDPSNDPLIPYNYTKDNAFSEKHKIKLALQKRTGLPEREDVFTMGIVSRITDQKGFDLIAYILEEMLSTKDLQLFCLGSGEYRFEEMLTHFAGKYPQRFFVQIGYSDELAHMIYAGCDTFLMPSLFEPCGLSQMISMRYGTVPIVRETGGLIDTVRAYNEYEDTGTGFSFSNYNAHEMYGAINYAMATYIEHQDRWQRIALRGMEEDFSWKRYALEYEELYRNLI
ncbi:MAG: glycogen synthase GlgA [Lachnospiraceae bacterium]|nr:glycogen synthase GlgA [Lachnospiraceae bacterium]